MATTNAAQLNMGYMYFPTAMLAKVPQVKRNKVVKDKNAETVAKLFGVNQTEEPAQAKSNGAEHFIPKNGKKRYSANKLAALNVITKMRSTYGNFGRLPHSLFERVLNLSHVTVNHSLADLRNDGVIIRGENGINDYYINPDFEYSEKDYITVYNFLFEENDFGGKLIKKLNFNAVLLLCFILRHYYDIKDNAAKAGKNNITPEEAYFVGGKQRIATLLNVPESTANDAIWELINAGYIYRKAFYIDDNCNEIICDGKGNSSSKQTVYVLNNKVIRLCDKVRAKMDITKKKRAKKAKKAAQKAKRSEAQESFKQRDKKAKKRNLSKAEQRQRNYEILLSLYNEDEQDDTDVFGMFEEVRNSRRSVTEEWAGTLKKLREQNGKSPEPFEEFTQHDGQPPTNKPTK